MSEQPDLDLLEREHGPDLVQIDHPDGSCFVFKPLSREVYDMREAIAKRGEVDADERMLQLLCVWPSREAWNEYERNGALEPIAYAAQFREAFGGGTTSRAVAAELPADADPSLTWFVNRGALLAFRKPGRAEVKLFAAESRDGTPGALEKLLRSCANEETRAWLSRNLFGIGSVGEAFVSAFGMGNMRARVSGK